MIASLRGHHFLCLTTYQGKGYSAAFVENLNGIWEAARQGEIARIRVTAEADPICQACPHLQDAEDPGSCTFAGSTAQRDHRMLEAMGWQEGQVVEFGAAMDVIHFRHKELSEWVCQGCDWQGICRRQRFSLRPDPPARQSLAT